MNWRVPKVPVLWTVYHPANLSGNRHVIQRTAKRLSFIYGRPGHWNDSPRVAKDDEWHLWNDFRQAMKPLTKEKPKIIQLQFSLEFELPLAA